MSTLNTRKIKHDSSAVDNITLTSNGRVGIATNSPTQRFVVYDPTGGSDNIVMCETSSGHKIFMQADAGGQKGVLGTLSNHPLAFVSNNIERIRIDTSGRVTMPYQPAFHAFPTSSFSSAVNGTNSSPFTGSNFSSTEFNVGSNFNTSNARFTAPVTGIYKFNFNMYAINDPGVVCEAKLFVNGQERRRFYNRAGDNINNESTAVSGMFYLSAGDYVQPGWFTTSAFDVGGNQAANEVHYTYFEGYLVS